LMHNNINYIINEARAWQGPECGKGGRRLTPRIPGPGPTGPRPPRTRTTDPIPDSPRVTHFRGEIAPR
jgi:hypothetical protein